MLKRIFVCAPLFLVFCLATLRAQSVCPLNGTLSAKLVFGVPQIFSNPYTDHGHCADLACSNFTPGTTHPDLGVRTNVDYNILNASFGLKYRLVHQLIITGNVLVKLNDNGLRATAVPLIGASYSF